MGFKEKLNDLENRRYVEIEAMPYDTLCEYIDNKEEVSVRGRRENVLDSVTIFCDFAHNNTYVGRCCFLGGEFVWYEDERDSVELIVDEVLYDGDFNVEVLIKAINCLSWADEFSVRHTDEGEKYLRAWWD